MPAEQQIGGLTAEGTVDASASGGLGVTSSAGTTLDDWQRQADAFFDYYTARHGALDGKPYRVTPDTVPGASGPSSQVQPFSPVYEYRFTDGTTVRARWTPEGYETRGYNTSALYDKKVASGGGSGVTSLSPNEVLIKPNAQGGYDVVASNPAGKTVQTAAPGTAILDASGKVVDTVPDPLSPYQAGTLQIQARNAQLAEAREARLEEAENRRAQAEAEKTRLEYLVQTGKMKADDANARYQRWFDENVKIPFLTAAEERARTTELRENARFEMEQRQGAAKYELDRSQLALQAGQTAVDQYTKTLPYRVGPGYGAAFSSAIDAVANADPSRIHVPPDAVTYDAPDFNALADQATAKVLATISPYAQAIQQAPVTKMPTTTYANPIPVQGQTIPKAPDYPAFELPVYKG